MDLCVKERLYTCVLFPVGVQGGVVESGRISSFHCSYSSPEPLTACNGMGIEEGGTPGDGSPPRKRRRMIPGPVGELVHRRPQRTGRAGRQVLVDHSVEGVPMQDGE